MISRPPLDELAQFYRKSNQSAIALPSPPWLSKSRKQSNRSRRALTDVCSE